MKERWNPPGGGDAPGETVDGRACAGERLHIGFVLHSLGGGGAERVATTLATQLVEYGHRVDMVLGKAVVDFPSTLPPRLRLFHPRIPGLPGLRPVSQRLCRGRGVELRGLRPNAKRAAADFARLRRRANGVRVHMRHRLFAHLAAEYLRRERPSLLLSSLAPANFAAINGARLTGNATPVVISVHSNPPLDYSGYEQGVAAKLYPRADAVVAVSCALGAELERVFAIPQCRVRTIYNPVPAARIRRMGREEVAHPWFRGDPPVILSVGREAPAKDFSTLVEAFGCVRREMAARLVIMGRHSRFYRARLSSLARRCGVDRDVDWLDFDENPFRYMARASVVAVSSFWEGLPTVLLEAMACGTPVVSTDTRFGPREILGGGKWGRLAPVGDVPALGRALLATLRGGGPCADALRLRADDFSEERAAKAYLRVFGQASTRPAGRCALPGALEFAAQTRCLSESESLD